MGRKSIADERKMEILGHLYMALKEEGLEGASVGKIADRMGINPSLIIHYFKTKEEMMVEMVDVLLNKYEEAYLSRLDQVSDPESRFELVLDAVLGVDWLEVSDSEVFYACHYMSFHNERVKKRFTDMYSWFYQLLHNEVEAWKKAGLIAENDSEQIADLFITLNEGSTFLWSIQRDKNSYRKRGEFLKRMMSNLLQNLKVNSYI